MEIVLYNNKIECNRKKYELYELYKYYLHNITSKWMDPLAVSAMNSVLYLICTAFLSLFLVCFMPKCCVFQRVLSCKCVILCLFSCTHDTLYFNFAFAPIIKENMLNNGSKDLCLLVECVTV